MSLNAVNPCDVAARRQRRSGITGAHRTLRHPPIDALPTYRARPGRAAQEAALTVHVPHADETSPCCSWTAGNPLPGVNRARGTLIRMAMPRGY